MSPSGRSHRPAVRTSQAASPEAYNLGIFGCLLRRKGERRKRGLHEYICEINREGDDDAVVSICPQRVALAHFY
jgi:hypothetical protein